MPQSPFQVYPAVNSGVAKPLQVDASGALIVADNQNSESTLLNVTAATVVKASSGYIGKISVTTAGAAGAVYDYNSTSGTGAASLVAVIPAAVGIYTLDFPVTNGIVVAPGAAQVVSVSYR
jgi:hypothetical protein